MAGTLRIMFDADHMAAVGGRGLQRWELVVEAMRWGDQNVKHAVVFALRNVGEV